MAKRAILPIDELSAMPGRLARYFGADGHIRSKKDRDDIIDELLDLFLLAAANAENAVDEQFGKDVRLTGEELTNIVYKKIDGATWVDRVKAWYEAGGTEDDILKIAETEAHRIGNTAALMMAQRAGAREKTWMTRLDDKVRDTHAYLEAVTVPIDAEFYTFDGDRAQAPGLFSDAKNNVNCRCELAFT